MQFLLVYLKEKINYFLWFIIFCLIFFIIYFLIFEASYYKLLLFIFWIIVGFIIIDFKNDFLGFLDTEIENNEYFLKTSLIFFWININCAFYFFWSNLFKPFLKFILNYFNFNEIISLYIDPNYVHIFIDYSFVINFIQWVFIILILFFKISYDILHFDKTENKIDYYSDFKHTKFYNYKEINSNVIFYKNISLCLFLLFYFVDRIFNLQWNLFINIIEIFFIIMFWIFAICQFYFFFWRWYLLYKNEKKNI